MADTAGWAHVGDEGTYLEIEFRSLDGTAKDISSATTQKIYLQKPDGTDVEVATSFTTDGTDGKIRYSWQTGDLDTAGLWRVQGFVSGSGFVFHTARGLLRVRETLQ